MSDEIFNLLMLILMLENGGGTSNINQMIITFLLMQNRSGSISSSDRNDRCGENGFTF